MYNLTNLLINLIFIFLVTIFIIIIITVIRGELAKKFYTKNNLRDDQSKIKNKKHPHELISINPVVFDHTSYFKIYKLNKNYIPFNFFNNDKEDTTIFLKREKNYDIYKDRY